MALRLDPASFSPARLRADIRALLAETALLLENAGEDRHAVVLEVRKRLKRLRALYRLTGDKDCRKQENARLASAARLLAAMREASALIETARWLAENARTAEESALLARLTAAMETRRDRIEALPGQNETLHAAASACRAAIPGTSALCLPDDERKMAKRLEQGWRRMMRQARHTLSPLTVDSPAEDFHALRKCVRTLYAYHGLLKPLWPQPFSAQREKLATLLDTLGHENDLAALAALMASEPAHFGAPIEQVVLQRIIARRCQALRLHALQQAAPLLATDPREDARRIGILWKALA